MKGTLYGLYLLPLLRILTTYGNELNFLVFLVIVIKKLSFFFSMINLLANSVGVSSEYQSIMLSWNGWL